MTQNNHIVRGAAAVIKELMERDNVSKADLARKAGVSRGYVTQALSEEPQYDNIGSLETMDKFATALGYNLNVATTFTAVSSDTGTLSVTKATGSGKLVPRKPKGKKR